MSTRVIPFVLALGFLLSPSDAQQPAKIPPKSSGEPSPSSEAEQEINRIREQSRRAFLEGDYDTIDRLWSDDFFSTTSWGAIRTKAESLQGLRKDERKFLSLDHDDIKVRIYGDAAVETGRVTYRGLSGGQEIPGNARYTLVFVKQLVGWRIVAHQVTNIAPADAAQQDRNAQSEARARRVIDAFNLANNRRDVEGLRNASNFPFVRIASGKVSITPTREEFTIQDWPPGAAAEGWHHSSVDSVQFIHSSSDKVHAAVIFSRYKADGTRYATYSTLRIITKQDGHWGIQCSSSFAP